MREFGCFLGVYLLGVIATFFALVFLCGDSLDDDSSFQLAAMSFAWPVTVIMFAIFGLSRLALWLGGAGA